MSLDYIKTRDEMWAESGIPHTQGFMDLPLTVQNLIKNAYIIGVGDGLKVAQKIIAETRTL